MCADTETEFMATITDILSKATDGRGLRVKLYSGSPTSEGLRQASISFGHINDGFSPVFIGNFGSHSTPDDHTRAEAAWWRNLALLANATATAIEYEQRIKQHHENGDGV
jgi:hypothetical protein